jgi:hypothetical protein
MPKVRNHFKNPARKFTSIRCNQFQQLIVPVYCYGITKIKCNYNLTYQVIYAGILSGIVNYCQSLVNFPLAIFVLTLKCFFFF